MLLKSILVGETMGILGINRRNLKYVYPGLKRHVFKIADQKLLSKELFQKCKVAFPETLTTFERFGSLMEIQERLNGLEKFVIKPNRGRQGSGIMVLGKKTEGGWLDVKNNTVTMDNIRKHIADIIMGVYSKGIPDIAIIEKRIYPHPFFSKIFTVGLPDIRIIVYKHKIIMAMLRVPTKTSGGKANLHQGGIGIGIDIDSGTTTTSIFHGSLITKHPDSHVILKDHLIPYFKEIKKAAVQISKKVPLKYIGFDFSIDENTGPMLLEMNARPGLEIQKANQLGLRRILENAQ